MYFSSFFPQPFATFFPSFFKKSELIKKVWFYYTPGKHGNYGAEGRTPTKEPYRSYALKAKAYSLLREAKLLPPSYPNNNNHHPINKLLPLPLRKLKAYWEDLIAQEL